jgi:hypothetical protein
MSIVAAAVIITGFAGVYPQHALDDTAPLPAIIHAHAAVFICWLVLLVAQTTLVSAGRTDIHRRLGAAGAVLAALMLVLGIATTITVARLGHRGIPGVEFPDAQGFLLLNLGSILCFATLTAAALYLRRSPQAHKRLMLMATTGALMPPGISRLPFVAGHTPAIGALVFAFIMAGPVYDLVTRRRIHPAYIWGVLLSIAVIPPIVGAVSAIPPLHELASWLMR